jgi:hypothetical protein
MGTPHRGSSKEALAELIATVATLTFRQPNKQIIRVLKPESDVIENQRETFVAISSGIKITCFVEELPTAVGVVSKMTIQLLKR